MTQKSKILERVQAGKLTREELEALKRNVLERKGPPELLAACEEQLSRLPKEVSAGKRDRVAEARARYSIMESAMDKGSLRIPALVPVAEYVADLPGVTRVSILKTQIRLYYREQHMVVGVDSKDGYWMGILDDSKLSDSTIAAWDKIGKVRRGTHFKKKYVDVHVSTLPEIGSALTRVSLVR